LRMDRG